MARSKQTAGKSTGGKFPKKQVAARAAQSGKGRGVEVGRGAAGEVVRGGSGGVGRGVEVARGAAGEVARGGSGGAREGSDEYMRGVDFVIFKGDGEFVLKYEDDPRKTIVGSEFMKLLDPMVFQFCMANTGLKVTAKSAVWWGLLDRELEEVEGTTRGEYTVRWVKFDPKMGVEGERTRGGFLGKEGDRSQPFPIRFYSLGGVEGGLEVGEELLKLYDTCTEDRIGKWVQVGRLGSRRAASPGALAPYVVDPKRTLLYRSTESRGCVHMAAANALQPYDSKAAEKVSKCDEDVSNLRQFSRYIQEEVRTWSAEDPLRRLARETSKTYMGALARLEWLLQQESGIFVVQPLIKHGGNSHIIGVDCGKKVVYDPLEQHILRLEEEVMGLCAGGSIDRCRGIGDVRQLKPQEKSQAPKKRLRRSNKGRNRGSSSSNVY